jgi:hypothetical protein
MESEWPAFTVPGSAIIIAILAVGITSVLYRKKKEQKSALVKVEQKPEKWVRVGKVESLIIFPIKSCPGVQVNEAVVTTLGLKCKLLVLCNSFFL